MKLKDRVALIIGATGVIGEEVSLLFAREGASVAVAARTESKLEALASKICALGHVSTACRCDVTKSEDIVAAVNRVAAELGPIDILVNSAGVISYEAVRDLPLDVWERTMSINVTGPFVAIQAVLPAMIERKWGRIINMGSISSKIGFPFRSGYAASKHALAGLTKSLSMEVAESGITANCVCPTFIRGDMLDESIQKWADKRGVTFETQLEELRNRVPIKRFIQPSEVAGLTLLLASEEGAAITGQSINVDGGIVQF